MKIKISRRGSRTQKELIREIIRLHFADARNVF